MKLPLLLATFTGLACASLVSPTSSLAQFRIETEVYLGESSDPVSQNLTIFDKHMVYDFQMSNEAQPKPVEVVIYDMREKYFILVDTKRNVRHKLDQLQAIQIRGARCIRQCGSSLD